MNAGQLFRKTMPFCMAKLFLGGALILILSVLLGIFVGVGWLFGETGMIIGFIVWCGTIKLVHLAVMNYAGYLVKAGHVAVLAEIAATGQVPPNQVNYGKDQVKERFLTANAYFALDKLVSTAVKQIQQGIQKVSNKLNFIPGMEQLAGIAKFFVNLSLGYIDECCLGYTFYKKEQGAFQSACDGVVIYAQNIVHLLKNAAVTMLKVSLATVIAVIVIFIPVGILFKLLKWSGLIAFVVACLIAWVVKFAFLDSYVLCLTMAGYMEVAPTTQITFDLYKKLSVLSSSFKEMWETAKTEAAQHSYETETDASYEAYTPATLESAAPSAGSAAGVSRFCGQCGEKNESGAAFCGNCGAKL